MKQAGPDFRKSLRRHLVGASAAVALLAGGVGGWAATTELSGAVIAVGKVVVASEVKKVQHTTGGVVGEILVTNGSKVRAGDVVVRLDATTTRANLAIISKGLDEISARQARLEAERDGLAGIVFGDDLLSRQDAGDVRRILTTEEQAFTLRRDARRGQQAQFSERILQLREQIAGLELQSGAKQAEIDLVRSELTGLQQLWKQKLVSYSRVTELEREEKKLEGEHGALIATIAQTKGRISETGLQILQVDQDLRSDVARELSEANAKAAELGERRIAAQDQLDRIDIRAPQTGYVHQLSVHTIGGVVAPQETLMLVVPTADQLSIDVRIPPSEIDQVHRGQSAFLRFPAFNQRTTPEIGGTVERISPDLIVDQATGIPYFEARITPDPGDLADAKAVTLVPGMPVDAFMRTSDRSVLSYLLKPVSDYLAQAFRKD